MKINDFISSLPSSVISGDNVLIPDVFFRKMFSFCNLNSNDIFYYLGVGNNYSSLLIAKSEFSVQKAVGIDINPETINMIKSKLDSSFSGIDIIHSDMLKSSLSDATVIFSWFTDDQINEKLSHKFRSELSNDAKIVSIWSPPDLFIPDKVDFPLILCKKPFKIGNIKDQLQSIYGNDCLDFTASWRLAEKYIQSLGVVDSHYIRFLNILQSVVIWLNARDFDLVCEDEIPPPIKSYVGILKYFFNIDLSEFLIK
ncbi:MAG TPA: class I SAM-dependent methyltransferase [Candidatus Nitrosocosmicus sp.]